MLKRLAHALLAFAVLPFILVAAVIGTLYYGYTYVVDGDEADA